MQSLITSYLLQSRECSLEQIGTIRISSKSAELDIVNKQILPPLQEIIFIEDATQSSTGLIKYIAQKKGYSADVAESILTGFCNEWKDRLDEGESFVFETLGSLQKNNEGNIYFKKAESIEFLKAVIAERVLHKNADHTVLIGDKEISSSMITDSNIEQPMKNSKWWVWALILGVVASSVLAYHFSKHNFSGDSMGNQTHIIVDSAGATHSDVSGN